MTEEELRRMNAYWRAANYLSVGQIYLLDNPLLREPLRLEHVKPRLLGHWGTTPGLNFIYVHLNRVILANDLNMICIAGPGHGGPAMVANSWLEGTYSEVYPDVPRNEEGMRKLFRQFSFPGGIGENDAEVRRRACEGLSLLGIAVDEGRNGSPSRDPREIQRDGTPVKVLVIPTNEELEIALQAVACIRNSIGPEGPR